MQNSKLLEKDSANFNDSQIEKERPLTTHEELMLNIRSSSSYLNSLIDHNPDPWYMYDLKGFIVDCNHSFEELIGYKKHEIIGKCFLKLKVLPLIQRARAKIILDKNSAGIVSNHDEYEFTRKDGSTVNVEINTSLVDVDDHKLVMATVRDIEKHAKREEEFQKNVESREEMIEILYKQIEKNLQIVTSLMNLQKAHLRDSKDVDFLQDTQNRVKSIRKAYEKLLHSPELTQINFSEYAKSILSGLLSTYTPEPGNIRLDIQVEDAFLDLDTAIPLGMVLSELVSNSFRHAFKPNVMGQIRVIFYNREDYYLLKVQDNGKGFPDGVNFGRNTSLGLQLVKSLVKQIDGEMKYKLTGGSCFSIKVPKSDNKENPF